MTLGGVYTMKIGYSSPANKPSFTSRRICFSSTAPSGPFFASVLAETVFLWELHE